MRKKQSAGRGNREMGTAGQCAETVLPLTSQLQEMSMKTTKSRVSGVLVGSRESTTLAIDITGRPQSPGSSQVHSDSQGALVK